jgi:rhamnose transport system ATP-binding protein
VSLSVRRGEILGLAGLVGSGRTQLAEAVFGLAPVDSGEIRVHGQAHRITSPADAIRAGIGYVPEDRRRHGVVLEMSIAANTSLASLRAMSRWGLIDRQLERKTAERSADRFRIKPSDVSAPVATLSGGNQQKVAVARWLTADPSVLILDEPTQGVDVGSKAEIHALMQELTEVGLAIIMISSDLPEVLGMSDRIVVMRQGRIRGELSREDATPAKVLALALDERSAGPN